jgi:alpha-tubulin suppressor-like RCC1 family protein
MLTRRIVRLIVAMALFVIGLTVSTAGSVGADANEGRAGVRRGAESVISMQGDGTCALLANATVKCWGRNDWGQLGQGNTLGGGTPGSTPGSTPALGDGPNEMGDNLPPIALGAGRTATAISAGGFHSCALLDNGTVKCWGLNFYGELGQGDVATRGDGPNEMGDNLAPIALGAGRRATAISAGYTHTCALLDNGTIKCWGQNDEGQLGQGSIANLGDAANEMGDNLPVVALGAGRTATAISAARNYTCAVLDNGAVKCWGVGLYGQLGQGDVTSRGDGRNEMGDNLAPIALGADRTATAISAGEFHVCALLDNGAVKCWGANTDGRLGLGDVDPRGDGPNEMGDNLPSVDLGTGRTASAISAGAGHSCAILDTNFMKCWGSGSQGQLGQGTLSTIGDAPSEMGDFLPTVNVGVGRTVAATAAGYFHTCALLDNAVLKCWGYNTNGQLGQGNNLGVGSKPSDIANLAPVSLGAGSGALVIPVAVAPAAPTLLSGTPGVMSVALSWNAPSDTGGASITGYRIDVSTNGGQNWATAVSDTGSPTPSRTISDLAAGQPVRFRVAAINNKGVSPASLPSAVMQPTVAGYTPLNPARLLDTRVDGVTIDGLFHTGTKLAGGQEIALQVTGRGGVPSDATSVVLNVTVTDPEAAGYITAYPCGTPRPNASNLNYTTGQTIPNNVIVKIGVNGTICLFTQQTTNLIADINGALK